VFTLNVWFVLKVEQKFDPMWYLNSESYPMQYNNKLNEHFPEYGKRAAIYLGKLDIFLHNCYYISWRGSWPRICPTIWAFLNMVMKF